MTLTERIDTKTAEIEALTAYANGVTGQADTNIGDAVKTLCDGYGGGDIDAPEGLYIGIVEVTENSPYLRIEHQLGKVCRFNLAVDITDTDLSIAPQTNAVLSYALLNNLLSLTHSGIFIQNATRSGWTSSTMTNTNFKPEFGENHTTLARTQYYNPVFYAGHKYLCVCK